MLFFFYSNFNEMQNYNKKVNAVTGTTILIKILILMNTKSDKPQDGFCDKKKTIQLKWSV